MPTYYTRSDGKRIKLPDGITEDQLRQVAEVEEASIGSEPLPEPKPVKIGGDLNALTTTVDKAKQGLDWAINQPLLQLPNEAWQKVESELTPIIGANRAKILSDSYRGWAGLAEGMTTPASLASLPLTAIRSGALGVMKLGSGAMKAAELVDRAVAGGTALQGANTVMNAAQNADATPMERVGQSAGGLMQMLMGTLGAQKWAKPKPDVLPSEPVKAPTRALPAYQPDAPTSTTEPRFIVGAGGVADQFPPQPPPGYRPLPDLAMETGQTNPKTWQPSVPPLVGNQVRATSILAQAPPPVGPPVPNPTSQTTNPYMPVFPNRGLNANEIPIDPITGKPSLKLATDDNFAAPVAPVTIPLETAARTGVIRPGPGAIPETATNQAAVNQASVAGRTSPAGQISGSGEMPWLGDEKGFVSPLILNTVTGGMLGGFTGLTIGETPEERIKNALGLGMVGMGLGYGVSNRFRAHPGSSNPRLIALREAQKRSRALPTETGYEPPGLLAQMADSVGTATHNQAYAFKAQEDRSTRALANRKGISVLKPSGEPNAVPAEKSGYTQIVLHIGGGKGDGNGVMITNAYKQHLSDIDAEGLAKPLDDYLNLKGFGYGADVTISEHIADNLLKAQQAIEEGQTKLGKHYQRQAEQIMQDLADGKLFPQGYHPELIKQDLAALQQEFGPQLWAAVEEMAKPAFQLGRDALALSKSMISPELYQKLVNRAQISGDYIPLNRIMDAFDFVYSAKAKGGADLPSLTTIRELAGSMRDTVNPRLSPLQRFESTVAQFHRNEAAKAVAGMAELGPEFNWIKPLIEHEIVPKGWTALHYLDQGEQKLFALPTHLARSVQLMTGKDVNMVKTWLGRLLNKTSGIQRWTAIGGNTAFATANVLARDPGDAMALGYGLDRLNPRAHAEFAIKLAKNWKEALLESPAYMEFLRSGAANSGLTAQLMPEYLSHGVSRSIPGKVGQGIARYGNASEMATKMTGMETLLKAGWSKDAAAMEVRRNWGSPDFWLRGTMMNELGPWGFLLNGAIQGVTRNARLFKDPKLLAQNVLLASAAALTIARWNAGFKDSDGKPSIQRVSADDLKENFVFINPFSKRPNKATGQDEWDFVKVPMGFTQRAFMTPIQNGVYAAMGLIEGDPVQTTIDMVSTQIPGQFKLKKDHMLETAGQGLISSMAPLPRTAIQLAMNQNTSFGIPIVPESMASARATDQWSASTDPLARLASKGVGKVMGDDFYMASPKRLEHLMTGFGLRTGGVEPFVKTAGRILAKTTGLPQTPSPEYEKDPIGYLREYAQPFSPIIRRYLGSGIDQVQREQIDDFYDLYGKMRRVTEQKSFLGGGEMPRRPEEAQVFMQDPEHQRMVQYMPFFRKIATKLQDLHKQRIYWTEHPGPAQRNMLKILDTNEAQVLQEAAKITKLYNSAKPEPVR